MPKFSKDKGSKRGGSSSPYDRPSAPTKSTGKGISGFKMNTNLGQHILKNPGIAEKIVEKANLKQSDIVLEVGPGTGNLTVRILEQARKVIAVEMDPRMAAELTKRVQGKPEQRKLEIMLGDIIKTELPHFDVCISNTPYQISSPLVFKLLALDPSPRTFVLMFQKEFADRLTAQPGQALYSRLSANVQMWSRVTPVMKVSRGNFKPPPQVDSAVVKIEPKVPRPTISYDEWDGILRIIFSRKNKTIYSNFNTKKCYSMIGTNYQTWCVQNNVALNDKVGAADVDEDMEMDGDEDDEKDDEDEKDEEDEKDLIEEDDIPQDFGGRASKRDSKTKVNKKLLLIAREKVKRVLDDATDLGGRRAAKCDQGDFLSLLYEFNQEGIHFSGADAKRWGFRD